jgi:uncharacterized protein with FMN-binding domain
MPRSLPLPTALTAWLLKASLSVLLVFLLSDVTAAADDLIEFLSGTKVQGTVTKIDKDAKQVAFEALVGGSKFNRVYPYSAIHAVTYQGKRYVINEKAASTATSPSPMGTGTSSSGAKTPAAIKQLIDQAGKTPPDWLATTTLDYPKTLDLFWPEKAEGGWNNQKNVGQYIWDIINPNPNRWQSGVKLMHQLFADQQNDPVKKRRNMKTLASMYFNFFQDYARAAYWWQQAGVGLGDNDAVSLAECYYRLGNKKMAQDLLADPDRPKGNNTIHHGMIKLWGDMGETAKAVKTAEWYIKVGGEPHIAYLLAGDACRIAGKYPDAIKYYQKVLDTPPAGRPRVDQTIKRAQASLDAVKLFELSDVKRVADGAYRASSQGYEGPIEVEVKVAAGRIEDVRVTRHTEKQFYSALTDAPQQIIAKQGVKGVDTTSRATITAEAIINASAKALASGAK